MAAPEPSRLRPVSAGAPPVRVWVAEESELATAAGLLGEFRDWHGYTEPDDAEMLASVRRVAASDGEYLLGSTPEGTDGVLQLRYRWSVWTTAPDAWIEDVFVRERARRRGLGRALVELAIERARERGCRRIELDVDEDNAPALRLYRELGFSEAMKAKQRSLLMGRRLE